MIPTGKRYNELCQAGSDQAALATRCQELREGAAACKRFRKGWVAVSGSMTVSDSKANRTVNFRYLRLHEFDASLARAVRRVAQQSQHVLLVPA